MTVVFMFPGQGSQFVGMGKDLYDNFPAARDVFREIDDILGRSLSEIIFHGPEEKLTATDNAQLSLMAVSVATVRAIESIHGIKIQDVAGYSAGHSVGEYSALHVSGVLDLSTVTKLLEVRSKAMHEASCLSCGGMIALIGGTLDVVSEIVRKASEHGVCEIANDNCEGQVVVSGVEEALSVVPELAASAGIKRAIRLKVSGPFHTSLMRCAHDRVRDFMNSVDIGEPKIKVVYNVSAREHNTGCESIVDLVAQQVVQRVRWRESMLYLLNAGCSEFIEVGPGAVLTGLLRRIGDGSARGINVNTLESIHALSKSVACSVGGSRS
ncbi:ACP S-malonyltransferase [Anaplasma bovis]|uniref:ACP S-malonyltransferase n=1 Tax=Anaplasma bovis TaxID=186733 RepID=UPI002FEFBD3F